MRFRDRAHAGALPRRLEPWRDTAPVVVALPRGGVPVGAEIASALGAPLDVIVVRKLGHPLQPELGIGAVGEGDVAIFNAELVDRTQVAASDVQRVVEREQAELARRVRHYRSAKPRVPVATRTVILVDDGLATGFTARAAVDVLRQSKVGRIVLAVPVAPRETLDELGAVADEVVCLTSPSSFTAVGHWYRDFRQVTDEEVSTLLRSV